MDDAGRRFQRSSYLIYVACARPGDDLTFGTPEGQSLMYFWSATQGGWYALEDAEDRIGDAFAVSSGTGAIVFLYDDALDPLAPNLTLDVEGVTPTANVSAGTEGRPFQLVANPFASTFDLGGITAGGGGTYQDVAQIWQPQGSDGSLGSYVQVSRSSAAGGDVAGTAAQPWQAFFLETADGASQANFALASAGSGRAAASDEEEPVAAALRLVALAEDGTALTADSLVRVVLHEAAGAGWDRYDATKLNPLSTGAAYAALAAVGAYHDGSERLQSAMALPPSASAVEVALSVQAGGLAAGQPLTLALEAVPEGFRVEIYDRLTGQTHDLAADAYVFAHDGTETQRSTQTVEIASKSGMRQTLRLGRPVPLAKSSTEPRLTLRLIPAALPVEMVSFEATPDGGAVALAWATASEEGNAGFYVECAASEGAFEEVGFVEGAGTTTETQRYGFRDADVPHGLALRYRLRQMDRDGTEHVSPVVEVAALAAERTALLPVVPSPVTASATVAFELAHSGRVRLVLYDALGRRVAVLTSETLRHAHGRTPRSPPRRGDAAPRRLRPAAGS